jgi:hypothetical protein
MLSKLFLITLVLAGLLLEVQTARAIPQVADYQSLSLEDCLTIAHKENPVLSASREKIQELVADYQAARSSFFPALRSCPIPPSNLLTALSRAAYPRRAC